MAKISVPKVWSLTYRLAASVIKDVAPAFAELGIEFKEWSLLLEIDAHPYPAELAIACMTPKPTVTMYLKHMESIGLVKREIDNADLRRHKLTLTPEGRKIVAKGNDLLTNAFGARLGRVSAAQQVELKQILEKLV